MTNESKTSVTKPNGDQKHMSLMGWDRLGHLREELDTMFDEMQGAWPFGALTRSRKRSFSDMPFAFGSHSPALDVIDKGEKIEVKVDLPGMDESDIDVEVSDRTLTISGEKKDEREEGDKEGDYYFSERSYGAFKRTLRIPEGVDPDAVKASFKKGVLDIVVPKPEAMLEHTKKIPVNGED